MIAEEKKRIRTHIRQLKQFITEHQKQRDAQVLFAKIEAMPEFVKANTVFLYWSLPDELPTHNFVKKWCSIKRIVLPAIINQKMVLKEVHLSHNMSIGHHGISEPDTELIYEGVIDLVIVPGVAFDTQRNRLGRGKGYYDQFLLSNGPFKIGVCFDAQLLPIVPTHPHDIKMDRVVTPSFIID